MAKRTRKPRTPKHTCGTCPACNQDRKKTAGLIAEQFVEFAKCQLDSDPCDWLDDQTVASLQKLDLNRVGAADILAASDLEELLEEVVDNFLRAIKDYRD
jgi:hypothetical protein